MRWYSTLKSILFRDRRSSRDRTARQYPKVPSRSQTVPVVGTLDRRTIRLRRD